MTPLKKLIFLSLLLLFIPNRVKANQCGSWFSNFTSPLCTDAKYIFWTGTAFSLALRISKDVFIDELEKGAVKKDHLDNWAKIGSNLGLGYLNAAYFLGQALFGGEEGAKRAEHMFEASFYTFGVTYGMKKSIHQSRPGFPDDPDSFPSGHSSFAFAFASVVTANHGWIWGGLAHFTATFIAFSRVNDQWHYVHDVVAGMTIGMSYGWGIYLNHEEHNKPYWFALAPSDDLGGFSLAFSYQF